MKRTKLRDRLLPVYSRGEEIMNMTTHIVGGALAILALVVCLWKAISTGRPLAIASALIYGGSMVAVYTMSSIYHGMRPGTGKKVLQVLDHCAIYLLIAGTYTPIVLLTLAPRFPMIGWGLFAAQWLLAALAVTLTAIDLRKYRVLSMVCYIGMGWCIVLAGRTIVDALSLPGLLWLVAGGVSYTVGAALYGVGKKHRWMHSVFHLFVVAGSIMQFICIIGYVI